MVTNPAESNAALTPEQEAQARARAELGGANAHSVVFRPEARVSTSAFDISISNAPAVVDVVNNKTPSATMSVLLAPDVRGTPQEQARAAAAPAVNAGVGNPAPSSGDSGAGAALANAIEVLSALTGKSQDEVRQAIIPDGKSIPDLQRTREFMSKNRSAIEQAIKPENLEKLPQAQRDALRTFLGTMGYPINAEAFGATPQQQAQALNQGMQGAGQDLGMDPSSMFMMLILGLLAEAFGLQGAFSGILGMMGGGSTRGMRTGSGGMGSGGGIGNTVGSGPARFSTEPQLEGIIQGVQGRGTIAGAVNLANALTGQHEVGDNGGAIVRATMGYTGDPWCGGFVRYVFDKSGLTGVYDQSDYRSAQSYMRQGKQHGAFRSAHSGYQPKPGDVLVFSSSRGADSGHVGMVVARNGDQVTYVSGNDSDAVRTRTISLSNPPGNLFGYTDTEALARAKGKAVQRAPEQVANPNARGTTEALGRTG